MKHILLALALSAVLFACESGQDENAPSDEVQNVNQQANKEPENSSLEMLEWEMMQSPTKSHIRGLCAVNDSVVWISGTGGVVYRTSDAGEYWDNLTLPECEDLDFRDIHAFDEEKALVVSAGYGVVIYGTMDGGIVWNELYRDNDSTAFFDGFDFWNSQGGLAYGDPQNGKMALKRMKYGWKWQEANQNLPDALEGEAGFAASGTGIVIQDNHVWIATGGGEVARVLHSADSGMTWQAHNTPLVSGEGMGIFSIAFKNQDIGVAVGGSYIDSTNTNGTSAYSWDGGVTWNVPEAVPRGYRSCAAFSPDGSLCVAVGRTGCDYSTDEGYSWTGWSDEGFWVCDFGGEYLWASGRSGKLGRVLISQLDN